MVTATRLSYLNLDREELQRRIEAAWELMRMPCRVCPRGCKVDRAADDRRGFCRVGSQAMVFAYHPHFGEEPVLVGAGGSGTIFFASCNLACVYCQNWEISQLRMGHEVEPAELAAMMLRLQQMGCHNVNLVSPTIYVPQILAAMPDAIDGGLRVPLVYNTGGYDSLEALRLLEGVVDIYMPDIKYSDERTAGKFSIVKGYYAGTRAAVKEMHRQVGDLVVEGGIAVRGLIIRHLVLPEGLSGTEEVMRFIAEGVSRDSYLNVMAQYRPEHKALRYRELSRRITSEEYRAALASARRHGLWRFAD
ncbi:MAG: radical SAM protein [Chloroflexi bacterium]|nr:radical SAM protein [Chloroflexota bacterium]